MRSPYRKWELQSSDFLSANKKRAATANLSPDIQERGLTVAGQPFIVSLL